MSPSRNTADEPLNDESYRWLGVPQWYLWEGGFLLIGRGGVTTFRPGDAVFGASHATCAEYASAPAAQLALKPTNLTFEQAAAVPTSALAALNGLRDAGGLKRGQKVLSNGAAGGIGAFAVQIAKAFGADVTGVCSTPNVELIRSIGADEAIDCPREDFTRSGRQYDLIFDNVENRSLSECRHPLTPTGTLVADLAVLNERLESGKLKPVIDRTFPLREAVNRSD